MMDNAYDSLPELKIPEDEAKRKIQSQIEKGQEIRDLEIGSEDDLSKAYRERSKWSKLNTALFIGIFSDGSVAAEYNRPETRSYPGYPSLSWQVPYFRKYMDNDIAKLESVIEKIELIVELSEQATHLSTTAGTEEILEAAPVEIIEPKVFIVHGTDPTKDRYELKSLLAEWGIDAVILHEQPSRGRTIIEKFEEHSEEVECAIILLTPDDEGRAKNSDDLMPRARQNVIFEWGFFIGRLRRGKTICLYKGNIELPSDIQGIAYFRFNNNVKDVAHDLRKELKDIGFSIKD